MQGLGKGDLTSLKDVFLIDDDLNVRYIASNGKDYGDQIIKKILEDETEIRFSSKAFSEYVSKISGISAVSYTHLDVYKRQIYPYLYPSSVLFPTIYPAFLYPSSSLEYPSTFIWSYCGFIS